MGWRLGLVGHPVAHSLSPKIHAAALGAAGLAGNYVLIDALDEAALARVIADLRAGHFDGLNVTIPHKHDAAESCDELVGDARVLGVANTLVRDGGRIVGHNTDVLGLVAAIRERWPTLRLAGREAAVLGAGGAGRAAVLAARHLGAERVRVWNRTTPRAHELASQLNGGVTVVGRPEDATRGAALVIQAGARDMGLDVGSEAWERAVQRALPIVGPASPTGVIVDLVYKPRRTPWVEAAARLGREADDGLAMLVHQAALAFRLWTGVMPSIDTLFRAVGVEREAD